MPISYLLAPEELAVLAYFAGIETLPFLATSAVDAELCDSLLAGLQKKGMVALREGAVCVDAALAFVLTSIAAASLIITAGDNTAYCTPSLSVISGRARHGGRISLTPLPNAAETAQHLYEAPDQRPAFCTLYSAGDARQVPFSRDMLQSEIVQVHTEENAP